MKHLLRALVPHFFVKEPIPAITNSRFLAAIEEVKKTPNTEAAMHKALDILADKFESKRFETYLLYWRLFERDPNKLWDRHGFLHCVQQNYLFRILMVKSEKLREDQIVLEKSLVWYISPHQYLKIILPTRTIAVDPWHYERGVGFGRYGTGFGVKSLS